MERHSKWYLSNVVHHRYLSCLQEIFSMLWSGVPTGKHLRKALGMVDFSDVDSNGRES
jgi:hypothetical protein